MHIAGISQATYYRVKDDMKRRRSWLRKVGSGSISKLKKDDKQRLYNMILKNPFLSPKDMIKNLQLDVSSMTVLRYLRKAGFIRRKPHGILDLTKTHIENRLSWANNMRTFRFYGEVVFTDETSIWLNDNGHQG